MYVFIMTTPASNVLDDITARFHSLYILEKSQPPDINHRIPSMFVFDRIASDMGYDELYSHEISVVSSHLGIVKKSITFNNADNRFIRKLKMGEYSTITPRMLAKYIQKYTNHKRITLVCIVGITERLPVLREDDEVSKTTETSETTDTTQTFEEVRSYMLDSIRKTTCYSDLRDTLRVGEEVVVSYASRGSGGEVLPEEPICDTPPTPSPKKGEKDTDDTKDADVCSVATVQDSVCSIRVIHRPFLFSLK